jgi:hypothetical protein
MTPTKVSAEAYPGWRQSLLDQSEIRVPATWPFEEFSGFQHYPAKSQMMLSKYPPGQTWTR